MEAKGRVRHLVVVWRAYNAPQGPFHTMDGGRQALRSVGGNRGVTQTRSARVDRGQRRKAGHQKQAKAPITSIAAWSARQIIGRAAVSNPESCGCHGVRVRAPRRPCGMRPRSAAVVAHLNQDLRRPSASEATDGLVSSSSPSLEGRERRGERGARCTAPAAGGKHLWARILKIHGPNRQTGSKKRGLSHEVLIIKPF